MQRFPSSFPSTTTAAAAVAVAAVVVTAAIALAAASLRTHASHHLGFAVAAVLVTAALALAAPSLLGTHARAAALAAATTINAFIAFVDQRDGRYVRSGGVLGAHM